MSTKKILIPVFILVFLIRLVILLKSSYTFYSDDAIYASIARMWIEKDFSRVFHPTWPPLFPALSALFYLVTTNFEFALRFVSLISGILLLVPAFYLMKKTLSSSHAWAFIFSLIFISPLLLMSLFPLSDSLAMLLTISGLATFFIALKESTKRIQNKFILIGSFLFALNYLTRPEGSMFFFFTMVFMFFYFLAKLEFKRILIIFPLALCIFLFTVSPYAIAIRFQIQEWSLSPKFSAQIQQGHVFTLNNRNTTWAQEVGSVKNPDYSSPYFKNGFGYVLDRFSSLKQLYAQKQKRWVEVFLKIFPVWSVVVILIGLTNIFSKKLAWPLLYLLFIMVTSVPLTIFTAAQFDIRYLAWLIPLLLYFFYLGIEKVFYIFFRIPQIFIPSIFLGFFLTFPGFSASYIYNPLRFAEDFSNTYDKNELKEVGLWIKKNTSQPNPRVMMRHEGVEFYSGGETIYLPQVTYEKLVEYAKTNKVDYIVAWDENLSYDDKLSILMDQKSAHPGLGDVYIVGDVLNPKVIVYKLLEN